MSEQQPPIFAPPTQSNSPSELIRREVGRLVSQDLADDSLVGALLKRNDWKTTEQLLESESPGLRYAASGILSKNVNVPEYQVGLCSFLLSQLSADGAPAQQSPGLFPLLRILAATNLVTAPVLGNVLLQMAEYPSSPIQEAVARVIAFRFPDRIDDLLSLLSPGIAQGLAYSGDASLAPHLVEFWNDSILKGSPPPALGFVLTPQWLAGELINTPDRALALARAFGYLDDSLDTLTEDERSKFAEALAKGVMTVTAPMLYEDPELLSLAQTQCMKQLLPWQLGMYSVGDGTDLPHDRWLWGIVVGALRAVEKESFEDKRDENPYAPRTRPNVAWARVCHTPYSYSVKLVVTEPLRVAQSLNIPVQHQERYLLEHAVLLLERDADAFREGEIFLGARWRAIVASKAPPTPIANYPIEDSGRGSHSLFARLILPRLPAEGILKCSQLSLGVRSAVSLSEYTDNGGLREVLVTHDAVCKENLPSIGCEIQVPFSQNRGFESLAWKCALRFFGISSPRRPEYQEMVEASFSPGWSYLVPILKILALSKLGLFAEKLDAALHISIGTHIGDDVRYLLFPQQFITDSGIRRYTSRLFSKGFACTHSDGWSPLSRSQPSVRTEIRSFRIAGEILAHATGDEQFIEDIICTHLLATAATSTKEPLKEVWREYIKGIEAHAAALPPVFSEFLHADWFQSSGEPYDGKVTRLLPIFQLAQTALDEVHRNNLSSALRHLFLDHRRAAAHRVLLLLPVGEALKIHQALLHKTPSGFLIVKPSQ